MRLGRGLGVAALTIIVLGVVILAVGYRNATAEPVVRRAYVGVSDWPAGAPPIKVLAIADIHVAGPDMPPERVRSTLRRLNRLRPDLVLVAGDFISEKAVATRLYSADAIVATLSAIEAPLGMIAVPGNHDHWAGIEPFEQAFAAHRIPLLRNTAVRRGPLRVAVIDDDMTGNADVDATMAVLEGLGQGPAIALTHSPDVVPDLPRSFAAIFAGHTHCGQIVLPLVGALSYASNQGERFGCGFIGDAGQRVFVGAGLGTSVLPLRYGAPPDVWLVTLGPVR